MPSDELLYKQSVLKDWVTCITTERLKLDKSRRSLSRLAHPYYGIVLVFTCKISLTLHTGLQVVKGGRVGSRRNALGTCRACGNGASRVERFCLYHRVRACCSSIQRFDLTKRPSACIFLIAMRPASQSQRSLGSRTCIPQSEVPLPNRSNASILNTGLYGYTCATHLMT